MVHTNADTNDMYVYVICIIERNQELTKLITYNINNKEVAS